MGYMNNIDKSASVSFIMPVFNVEGSYLDEAIQSVLNQDNPNWMLFVCDDASTHIETIAVLEKYKGFDSRIQVFSNEYEKGISGASNFAASKSTCDFLAFLDHDDLVTSNAVSEILNVAKSSPNVDFIYSDEDKLNMEGQYVEAYYKPDYSPDHLRSVMYILHLLVISRRLFNEIGGLRSEFDGAQDFDLALRATRVARNVIHIPKILYHWRMIPNSTALNLSSKLWALENGKKALNAVLSQDSFPGYSEDGLLLGTYRARYPIPSNKKVTLLILSKGSSRTVKGKESVVLVTNFIESILAKSSFKNFAMNVIWSGDPADPALENLRHLGCTIFQYPDTFNFNYSRAFNFALSTSKTNDVIVLNDDLEVISPDWIESLIELSQQQRVGAVGARLLFEDETIQHAGMAVGVEGICGHLFYRRPSESVGYQNFTHLIRNYSCITGAVFATRKDVMAEVGGMDIEYRVEFNDVDLCMRLRNSGYDIVYTPYSSLFHYENSSFKRSEPDISDKAKFIEKWGSVIQLDPYYNQNLPRNLNDLF
jgi:O-antigen biosynthesis protein